MVSEPSAISQEVTKGKLKQRRDGGIVLPFHMEKLSLCRRDNGRDRNPMASFQGCPQTPNSTWGGVLCKFHSLTEWRNAAQNGDHTGPTAAHDGLGALEANKADHVELHAHLDVLGTKNLAPAPSILASINQVGSSPHLTYDALL